jgi:uncharacterized protein YecE (DUF72 family)
VAVYWVGTSGWQYRHWRSNFYPEKLPQKAWFSHYAGLFSTVELNNSFHRQPSDAAWERWREVAPVGFRFAVKANRFITHIKRFKDPEQAIERFFKGARRLGAHSGPALFQAPPNFERDEENVKRLGAFLEQLPKDVPSVIEFRHESWYTDETLAMLRRYGVAICIHDMEGSASPVAVTSSIAYLRFHGSGARYGGSYADDQLREWANRIKDVVREVESVWVYFNNDIGGHAPRNASTLRVLLAG